MITWTGVTVGFLSPTYEAREDDGSAEICAVFSGTTEVTFTVTVAVIGGTASGQDRITYFHSRIFTPSLFLPILPTEEDYSSEELPLLVTDDDIKAGDTVCTRISLIVDDLEEVDETIELELSSNDSFINFTQKISVFTIIDSVGSYSSNSLRF